METVYWSTLSGEQRQAQVSCVRACERGDRAEVARLLRQGAQLNAQVMESVDCLGSDRTDGFAVSNCDYVDTLLTVAVAAGHYNLVADLLERGADPFSRRSRWLSVRIPGQHRNTPYAKESSSASEISWRTGRKDILDLLIQAMALPAVLSRADADEALVEAVENRGDLGEALYYLNAGASPNACREVVHWQDEKREEVEDIGGVGLVTVEVPTGKKCRFIMRRYALTAVLRQDFGGLGRDTGLFQLLLERGANPDLQDSYTREDSNGKVVVREFSKPLLLWACSELHRPFTQPIRLIRPLLDAGANINPPNDLWEPPTPKGHPFYDSRVLPSPLHYAARSEVELTHELLERGANRDARDGDGKTPLDYAQKAGNTETERLLKGRE